jgi:hypothetical protein
MTDGLTIHGLDGCLAGENVQLAIGEISSIFKVTKRVFV